MDLQRLGDEEAEAHRVREGGDADAAHRDAHVHRLQRQRAHMSLEVSEVINSCVACHLSLLSK